MLDFKPNIVVDKIGSSVYSKSTITQWHAKLRRYVYGDGVKYRNVAKLMYNLVDELRSKHYPKLTPNNLEKAAPFISKREVKHTTDSNNKLSSSASTNTCNNSNPEKININPKTLEVLKSDTKPYGVLYGDNIFLCEDLAFAKGYVCAFNQIDPNLEFKIVKLHTTEV